MSRLNWATGCHALALLIILAIGVVHSTRDILLPWSVSALGVPWDGLPAGVKAIFVSYMKLAGAGQIGVALALGIVLYGPFRRMDSWASQTIAGVGCVTAALSAYAIYTVQAKTGVAVPWYNPMASFVLFVAGYILSPRK